jgi:hypothetical protein
MREIRGAYMVLVGKPKRKRPLGKPTCRWRMILKLIFKKWDGAWIGFIWLRIRIGGGLL